MKLAGEKGKEQESTFIFLGLLSTWVHPTDDVKNHEHHNNLL